MTLPTLRAVEPELPTGPGRTEAVVSLVTELRERAEAAEAEARLLRDELESVALLTRALLAQTRADNPWATSALNLVAMRAESGLEAP